MVCKDFCGILYRRYRVINPYKLNSIKLLGTKSLLNRRKLIASIDTQIDNAFDRVKINRFECLLVVVFKGKFARFVNFGKQTLYAVLLVRIMEAVKGVLKA